MPSDERYFSDASKLRTPLRSQVDDISDNNRCLSSVECPEIVRDTPRNPLIGSNIKKNSPIVTERDLALVFRGRRYPIPPQFYDYDDDDNEDFKIRDIKPRNLLPLLLAEATSSSQCADSVESNIKETINDKDEPTTNISITNATKAKRGSDNSSMKPKKRLGQSRNKCITDYGKGTKQNCSKTTITRKSKRAKR